MKRFLALLLLLMSAACAAADGGGAGGSRTVFGRGLPKTQPDDDATRRIVLVYPYAHERLGVVYYHNGGYDRAALRKINYLFRDRHAHVVGRINPELIDYLVDIRTRLDLPPTVPFQILSGYRTPQTNARLAITNVNVAKESLHMRGRAVDFRIKGVSGRALAALALTMQRGGVAYYPEDNHVHVDLGNIRTWHEASR